MGGKKNRRARNLSHFESNISFRNEEAVFLGLFKEFFIRHAVCIASFVQSSQRTKAKYFASSFKTINSENFMNAKRMLLNAGTICLLATAVLLSQSALSGSASATPGDAPRKADNLKQRVKILELLQEEDDKEFLLVDASLSDLNARVEANEERCARTSKRLVETDKRAGRMKMRISENQTGRSEIRETIKRLKADLRANGIKLSD